MMLLSAGVICSKSTSGRGGLDPPRDKIKAGTGVGRGDERYSVAPGRILHIWLMGTITKRKQKNGWERRVRRRMLMFGQIHT